MSKSELVTVIVSVQASINNMTVTAYLAHPVYHRCLNVCHLQHDELHFYF